MSYTVVLYTKPQDSNQKAKKKKKKKKILDLITPIEHKDVW